MEESLEAGMRNFMRAGYKGVTETWNILQHEVSWGGKISYFNPVCCQLCGGVSGGFFVCKMINNPVCGMFQKFYLIHFELLYFLI